jgi:hypothetical protein
MGKDYLPQCGVTAASPVRRRLTGSFADWRHAGRVHYSNVLGLRYLLPTIPTHGI